MKPPIVFFHGVTRCGSSCDPLRPFFDIRWSPDFPGHGDAERRPGQYRVADQAAWAEAYVEALPAEKVVLYGHSMGAMVAAAVAARLPGRVAAAILEDPPYSTMGSGIRRTPLHGYFSAIRAVAGNRSLPLGEYARQVADLRYGDPATTRLGDTRDATALRFSAHALRRLDPAVLDPIVDETWMDGYELGHIQCPLLVLQADRAAGGMLTDEEAEWLATKSGDCTTVRVDGYARGRSSGDGLSGHALAGMDPRPRAARLPAECWARRASPAPARGGPFRPRWPAQ